MQIIQKIDQLISGLNELKPTLLNNTEENDQKFYSLLQSTIDSDKKYSQSALRPDVVPNSNLSDKIPNWVDPNYYYDPKNPRKPNMRELMEALSGKSLDELYREPELNWQKVSSRASEILYGVIGSNKDTRDWSGIMASEDILETAREHTGKMYEPVVDIVPSLSDDTISSEKIAVINDRNGNTLRVLSSNVTSTEEILLNFGASSSSIPNDLDHKIGSDKFDTGLLNFLKQFDRRPKPIEQIIIQTTAEVISDKLSNEVPSEELDKL